ncbi:MAG: hypothetical protein JXB18_06765 [Sedimentisphaerales bacterium]|nr:hypothetical protein [Sedimentisphaerales bacterium]
MGRKRGEEKAPGTPAWIVTFSDMITLLLTFFVMLQSMATVQIAEHKFEAGQAALKRTFDGLGISGDESSKNDGTDFEHPKPEYAAEEGNDEPQNRSLDAHTEMMRRVLMDIEKMAKITPSPISGMNRTFLPTDIHFKPGQITLNAQAQTFLNNYGQQLITNLTGQEITLYVLGIAAGERGEKRQWTMSAQRAQAVADFIRSKQPENANWSIYSWGAGPGGDWVGQKGLVSAETEIMIAVLTQKTD